ncbi:hypothetical protein CL633_01840 [bacterium]|nr:hypothetical protein [bacterium]|tara:strand:- start:124 stop:432 length:309 start_codon:yes stop_codon:yes gene_type:complete
MSDVDFGPWVGAEGCIACVVSIETNANGEYQGAMLQLKEDCANAGDKSAGAPFILRNKKFEAELKRAQSSCLAVSVVFQKKDGKVSVLAIKVLSQKICCEQG